MSPQPEFCTRTKQFALAIIRLCRSLPGNTESFVIAKQIIRSATSVAGNYRAAQRSRSRQEYCAKMGTVVEEADESLFWLEMLQESSIVPVAQISGLQQEADELVAISSTMRKRAMANRTG